MSGDSILATTERRSSDDLILKHVTLITDQVQKTLSKLTIPKVLVLYTGRAFCFYLLTKLCKRFHICISGGTIGMKVLRNAYEPVTNYLPTALREMNIMHDSEMAETMTQIDPDRSFLYLP